MNAKKLIAGLALALTLGLTSCGGEVDPTPTPTPTPTPAGDNAFSEAIKDKYAEAFKAGKFVVTCVGYEGMSQAETWCIDAGFTKKDTQDPTAANAAAGEFASHKLVDLDKIPSDYVVVCGVAYTGKGLTGITSKEEELARAEKLASLDVAGLILVEVAGSPNRGTVADALLAKVLPAADAVIAKTSANDDNYFTTAKTTYGFELLVASKAGDLKAGLTYLGCAK